MFIGNDSNITTSMAASKTLGKGRVTSFKMDKGDESFLESTTKYVAFPHSIAPSTQRSE